MRSCLKVLTACVSCLALAACANFNSISRVKPAPKNDTGSVFTVDAKQRHLIMSRVNPSNSNELRVCAEAAPDVFSAYATSLAAQGDKSGGQLGLGANETASTIERTQTINLLRESFYRTCERYLSGAINRTQFITQAARDHRAMVSILAIEQLTGAVRPASTIISPGGTAASVVSGRDAIRLINEYHKDLREAQENEGIAQGKVDEAKSGGACDDDSENKDEQACNTLNDNLQKLKKDVEEKKEALQEIEELAPALVTGSAVGTTSGSTLQGRGVELSTIDTARLAAVSSSVVDIMKLSSIDEPLMFCLAFLTDSDLTGEDAKRETNQTPGTGVITPACLKILENRAEQDKGTLTNAGISAQQLSETLIAGFPKGSGKNFDQTLDDLFEFLGDNGTNADRRILTVSAVLRESQMSPRTQERIVSSCKSGAARNCIKALENSRSGLNYSKFPEVVASTIKN